MASTLTTTWILLGSLGVFIGGDCARAGGWAGMGGEIYGDSMNPWFFRKAQSLQSIVPYCIEVDEANFHVAKASLQPIVQGTLAFWHDELAAGIDPGNGPDASYYLGKETFSYKDECTDEIALRFQFGVLSAMQKEKLNEMGWEPRQHVGMAIRTHYNEDGKMQGRGFIYVSPAAGELAMTGGDIMPDPWAAAEGQVRLNLVLRHELGHVFGLQHRGSDTDLMGATFPERVISKQNDRYVSFKPRVFTVGKGRLTSLLYLRNPALEASIFRFFGLQPGEQQLLYKVWDDRLQIFTSPSLNSDDATLVGEAILDHDRIERPESVIRLWLPDQQTVFTNLPANHGRVLPGPMIKHTELTGTYTDRAHSLERQMRFSLSPDKLEIGGIMDGRIVLDVLWLK